MNRGKTIVSLVSIGLLMLTSCTGKEKDKDVKKETTEQEQVTSQDRRADNDVANTEDDKLFYLYERLYPDLRNGLTIINTETTGDQYYEGDWVSCEGITFTVKNNTPYDVPGKAYSILYKEGYWGGGKLSQETIPGVDIKRGETAILKTKELSSSTESETCQLLKIKDMSFDEFKSLFHLSEEETETLVKNQSKKVIAKEPLSICVEGLMGGCATRLSLDGKQGHMQYNSRGKEYEFNQQRDIILVSNDSGKLVLRVEKDGTATGQLIGTMKNGVYTGQFKNVNGKSSPFEFE